MRPLAASDPRDIGRYRLLAELGRGGMGRVLLGSGPDGRLVALKLVHPRLAEDDGFRERFRREVAASRKVSGAYTAAVVDADPDAPTPWLASVFVLGPSLQEAIDRVGVLPQEPALRLAAGLAAALLEIHRAGLVHRDLKPSNVLLAEDGPRVIDFGIARATDPDGGGELTESGWLVGSPCFMSPEQALSRPLTPASDVFSLGTVLIMAATGHCPYAGPSTAQTLQNVVRASPDLGAMPERLRRIVETCQANDPGDRPDPAELLESIGQLVPAVRAWPPGVHALIGAQRAELEGLLGAIPDQPGDPLRRTKLQLRPPYLSEAAPPPPLFPPPLAPPPLFPPPPAPPAKPPRTAPSRGARPRAKPVPSRSRTVGSIVGVAIVLGLVLAAVSAQDRNDGRGLGSTPTTTSSRADPPVNPQRRPPDPTTDPAPPPNGPFSATVGACFEDRNATGGRSDLRRARCDPGNFKVLKRIDGQSDSRTWCAGVEGTNWPLEWDATGTRPAMVLCMQYLYASDIFNSQPGHCASSTPDGTSWHLVPCQDYTFQILQVIHGTNDHSRCGSDPRLRLTTNTTETRPALSAVVCMTFRYGDDGPLARTNDCLRLRGSGGRASPVFANCDVANAVVTGYNPTQFNPAWCGNYYWYGWNDQNGWDRFLNYTLCYRLR